MGWKRPRLTVEAILSWADEHKARTGKYPHADSGIVQGAIGETWRNIDQALRLGLRGLDGKGTLACLLERERGHRHYHHKPALTPALIVFWARAHRGLTGKWPNENSGHVEGAPGETWGAINAALAFGVRGLPGGDSLALLLAREAGAVNYTNRRAPLDEKDVLAWAWARRACSRGAGLTSS